jgi:hypothetical protein
MILRIECTSCNHVGLVCAETLPRALTCSACGSSRPVAADAGEAIVSRDRFEEWLAGERDEPRLRAMSTPQPQG